MTRPVVGDPNERTLWAGDSEDMTAKATKGKVAARYRLTDYYLYFERGTLKTDSQQIPLSMVGDVDLRQSMTQKARGVGDVVVYVHRGVTREVVTLASIRDPRAVRDLVNQTVHAARIAIQRAQNTMTHHQIVAPPVAAAPAEDETASKLRRLAQLRDEGLLTEAEFEAKRSQVLDSM